jgi:transcriptional regulator with XRE-family HTH domain
MEMTGEQLRYLREQRGMTRKQLADYLGDSTESTVNKWERNINPVPSWVADKMFSKLPITFTIEELSEMYEICREEGLSMGELLQEATRDLIKSRQETRSTKDQKPPPETAEDRLKAAIKRARNQKDKGDEATEKAG